MLSADTLRMVYDLIEQGLPCKEVASRTGISADLARYYGNKLGADMNRLGRANGVPIDDAKNAKILQMLCDGVPHRKIAKSVKCSAATVYRVKKSAQDQS